MKRWMLFLMLVLFAIGLTACNAGDTVEDVAGDAADAVGDVAGDAIDAVVDGELTCDDAIGCVKVAAGDPIKMATALVVTGPNESLGLDSQYGAEIAIADRGQLLGHDIEVQYEDDGCSAEGGQTAGQKIVSDPDIVGVVGTSCSGAGVPMSQIVCAEGIAMVSPSNTAPVLTGEGTRENCYFRTAHNDKIQGAAMADFAFNELGVTKAAAIHDGDPYTEGLASAFSDSFTALGGEIVAFEAEAAEATNVEPILTTIAASEPELIFAPVFIPLGSLIAKTVGDVDGLEDVILTAADAVFSPDFLEAAGDAADGMYLSGPDLSFGNEDYADFLTKYEDAQGTEPISVFHAHSYDAVNLILDAIEAIAQQDADGNLMIGRQALIDEIAATDGYEGLTGTLTCDANGDCADPKISVSSIGDGEFNAMWQFGAGMIGGDMGGDDGDMGNDEAFECTDAIGCVAVGAGDAIKMATALVVTGPNESLGLDSQYGAEIAITDRGQILGHDIELQTEDDGCSPEGGQTAGQKIVSDPDIVGVIGTSCSGAGVPMSQIVCGEGIVMVSPSNTAPVLTGEDSRENCYFRTAHNDKIQGAAMADFVYNELGLTKAAAIHDGDPYTEGLATSFSTAFEALGGTMVAFEAEAAEATNVEPLLTTIAASEPDMIFAPVFIPLGSLIAKTVGDVDGLEDVVLAAADGVQSPDFLEAAGDAADGMYLSGPDLSFSNENYAEFLATYEDTYGTEPISVFHAHSYDAANLIMDAIEAVAQEGPDGELLIGRQALIDQVAATSGYEGLTGTLNCDEYGDCADPKISVSNVGDGAFNPIWQFGTGMIGDDMGGDAGEMEEVAYECTDAVGCVEVKAGDPIKMATALVVTGPNESLGLDSQYGAEIAIAQRGEVKGHAIELQTEDDGCSPEGGQTAGQKIVSDPDIVGVIGTSCSGAGVPMSQIVCDESIVMVSPSNTAPVLTDPDTRGACYFRTAHNDKIQGAAMANYVFNELGLTKAAAIHDGDPYTEGLATVFRDAFTDLGGEIVAFEAEAAEATNVEPLLTTIAAAGPELIYAPVFIPLGSLIAKTVGDVDGLEDVVMAAADGVQSPDFLEAAGDAAEGMFLSGPDLSFGNDIYDAFLTEYEETYGTEPISVFHAHSYDAANLILDAIEEVAKQNEDGDLLIGRQDLIDAVAATSGKAGITGTLTCDENGDCADPQIAVSIVEEGAFVPEWQYVIEE